MFGFDWVKDFSDDQKNFQEIAKHKIIFQSARICSRIVDCFSKMHSRKKGLEGLMKNNKKIIVDTIDWLIPKLSSAKKACRIFNITSKKYYRWKGKIHCTASKLNLCFKTHPLQLSVKESTIIKDAINDLENQNKPRSTVFYSLLRNAKLFCGITTFYKYANLTSEKPKFIMPKKNYIGFRASSVFEYLHIDTTFMMTELGKRRVAFVKDNRCKAILHVAILQNGKSEFIRDLLETAFKKFNLHNHPEPIYIVSDDGSENKGDVILWVKNITTTNVTKLIAGKDFLFSNSMSESIHHLYKTFFARGKIYLNDEHLQKDLDDFVLFVNYGWFPLEFFGLCPMEVLKNELVIRNRFTEQIKRAQKQRALENKNFHYCISCN